MSGSMDRVGQQFGEYRLLRWLGKGSFGDVYLAEHVRDRTQVAVKLLRSPLTQREELKNFINEARTFRLKHPNILALLDFGIEQDDTPFLVMDYAPNGTLRDRHPKGSPLPLATIVPYVVSIASALQYAHNLRLVHRDVKPENMLVGMHNEILLSDFGIMAVAHSTQSLNTEEAIGGSVAYMAPEQVSGKPRPASDQYALAVVVYEWLCGQRPFDGTVVEVAVQHLNVSPPALRAQVPTISPGVEAIVLKALAKNPNERFADVETFARALQEESTGGRELSFYVTSTELPVHSPPVPQGQRPVTTTEKSALPGMPSPGPAAVFPQQSSAPPTAMVPPSFTGQATPVGVGPHPRPSRTAGKRIIIPLLLTLIVLFAAVGTFFVVRAQNPPAAPTQKTATVAPATVAPTTTPSVNNYTTYVEANGIMNGFDAQHSRFNPYEQQLSSANVNTLAISWSGSLGNVTSSSPAVANDRVYIGSSDGRLYAFKATGCGQAACLPLWISQQEGEMVSSPAVFDGVVYVGSLDHKLYAFAANGCAQSPCAPLWTAQTGNEIHSSPVVANGVVYVGSFDKKLYAFDAHGCGQGQTLCSPLWTGQTDSELISSPAVSNGVVYIGSENGTLYAFDTQRCSNDACAAAWTGQATGGIGSSPTVGNGVVYVGSEDKKLYAFDVHTCTQSSTSCNPLWTGQTGGTIRSSTALANGLVYIGSDDDNLYAFAAGGCGQATCDPAWTGQAGGKIGSSPTVANGVVYVGSDDHNLYAFKASGCGQVTCTPLQSVQTQGIVYSSPAVANGVVYVGSNDGNLYAFHT